MMKTKQLKFKMLLVKTYLPFVLLLLSFSSCSKKRANSRIVLNVQYKDEILAGREDLKVYLITSSLPGLSVSVSVNGETVWSEGMGLSNKELRVPAGPETKYRIGRTTHMFTAFLMARLQEEGKLKMTDSFWDYIPEYPKKQWDFTLKQLGTYSAGFPEDAPANLIKIKDTGSLKEYIKLFSNDSLVYPPDEYYAVSDYGISMLGILAEDVTETRFSKLMKDMVLDTLGLTETFFDNPSMIIENRAAPYYQNYIAQLINAPSIDFQFCAPSLGLLSTADDLNKAGQAILKEGFFKQESLDLFFTRLVLKNGFETNRGFGWWVTADRENRMIYMQMGSTIGGSSMLMVYPEQKLVVSVCSNTADETGSLPAPQIAEKFLAKIDPRAKPEETPPATDTDEE
ncbi:serine hydrolase domain-containing protein [Gaoshiqia sp. Z1-71]|uniref:serine hydrolase domain-containing protein n=1 Tax=Gaoshiqia hydrogeniformans TaxID=3290090 RepID=UPI003BF7D675